MFVSEDKEEKERKRREESRFPQREGEWWETVCLHVCVVPWPSSSSLFIELRLLPVSGAVPSRLDWVEGRRREGGRGGDEEREEVSGCVGGETGHV